MSALPHDLPDIGTTIDITFDDGEKVITIRSQISGYTSLDESSDDIQVHLLNDKSDESDILISQKTRKWYYDGTSEDGIVWDIKKRIEIQVEIH